jgi:hypothetical protein
MGGYGFTRAIHEVFSSVPGHLVVGDAKTRAADQKLPTAIDRGGYCLPRVERPGARWSSMPGP